MVAFPTRKLPEFKKGCCFFLQIPALTQSLARIVNALPCSLKLIINNVSSSVFVIVVINSHSKPLGSRFDNND